MNQFPKFTPRTFSPVENAGEFDPGSVNHTKLDANDGDAAISTAAATMKDAPAIAVLASLVWFWMRYIGELLVIPASEGDRMSVVLISFPSSKGLSSGLLRRRTY